MAFPLITKSSRLDPLSDFFFRVELRRRSSFGDFRRGSAWSGGDAVSTAMAGVLMDRGLVEKDEGARATASSSLPLILRGATPTGSFRELYRCQYIAFKSILCDCDDFFTLGNL